MEFARIDAPKTPVQLQRALPFAQQLFPLADPVESEPWLGARPAFGDMLPAIGKFTGLKETYVNIGHAHHGFTLGPASGKVIAQLIAGKTPDCDLTPFSPARFLR